MKVESLQQISQDKPENVFIYESDCNETLLNQVFPKVHWEDYRRGLCLLDPYGLDLDWEVLKKAGEMKSIDLFLNFPVLDMNRNVLWRDLRSVDEKQVGRMNRFWGDESWREIAYIKQGNLFDADDDIKINIENLMEGFRQRLQKVAGFAQVPKPIPMINTKGGTVYYLYFASHKNVAKNIVDHIFKKHGQRGKP